MSNSQRNHKYPKSLERYNMLQELNERDNRLIQILELAYAETGNERVFLALRELQTTREKFWNMDEESRRREMEEFYAKIGQWGDSVRDWFLHFHDKDMEA